MKTMIYIIIPVFNRLKFTTECIESLRRQTYSDYKIIVVDDGSTDGTAEFLNQHYPETTVLKGDGNLWWTGATNMGVKHVLNSETGENDFILTLNNDLVVQNDYLEKLVEIYNENKPCLVGSVSVDIADPQSVHYCGVTWDSFSAKQRSAVKLPAKLSDLQANSKFIKTDLLPGRGILIPISVFKKIGIYDVQSFPHYAADEDFSLRARKAGYQLLVSNFAYVCSHVNESNLSGKHQRKNFKYYYDFFFSIKSSCNLKYRYRWAHKHAKIPILYFAFDFSRICASQFKLN
jgi:GT2 family glycosyltransferase